MYFDILFIINFFVLKILVIFYKSLYIEIFIIYFLLNIL